MKTLKFDVIMNNKTVMKPSNEKYANVTPAISAGLVSPKNSASVCNSPRPALEDILYSD